MGITKFKTTEVLFSLTQGQLAILPLDMPYTISY